MIRPSTSLQFGILLCLIPMIMATISFFWQPFDVTRTKYIKPITAFKFNPPIWYRSLWSGYAVNDNGGAQTSIAVAFVAVGIGVLFGVPLGLFAANWRGGFIDDGIMRFNDLVFAFPSL